MPEEMDRAETWKKKGKGRLQLFKSILTCIAQPAIINKWASFLCALTISLNEEKEANPPPLSLQKRSEQVTVVPSASETQRIEGELLLQLLIQAYQRAATKGKSDWVSIQQLGTTLQQLQPGFASKTYGFPKLKGLIQSYPQVFQTRSLKGGQIELQAKIKQ